MPPTASPDPPVGDTASTQHPSQGPSLTLRPAPPPPLRGHRPPSPPPCPFPRSPGALTCPRRSLPARPARPARPPQRNALPAAKMAAALPPRPRRGFAAIFAKGKLRRHSEGGERLARTKRGGAAASGSLCRLRAAGSALR